MYDVQSRRVPTDDTYYRDGSPVKKEKDFKVLEYFSKHIEYIDSTYDYALFY